jgi:hypothetical protein
MSTLWLVLKALLSIVPLIVRLVRERRIREGAQKEVADAIAEKIGARVDAASDARNAEHDDSVPDPHDRANRG